MIFSFSFSLFFCRGIGQSFHKLCFKCTACTAKIEPGSECDKGGKLVCKKVCE